MFSDRTGKKMQILVFWHTVRNFIPSVRRAGIISMFEQKEKGKKSLVLPTCVIFLR